MNEVQTKTELLSQIRDERQALEATLSELAEEKMLQPGVEGEWSIKDILIHIVAWEQRMIAWLQQSTSEVTVQMLPPGYTWDDLDRWNQDTYLEHKDDLLADVLTAFAASYQEALAAADSIAEDALFDPERFSWREGKPLWPVVAANTCWHYKEHNQSIGTWLAGA